MLLCPISAITFCCAQLSCTNFASCAKSGSMGRQSQSQICMRIEASGHYMFSLWKDTEDQMEEVTPKSLNCKC